MVIPQQGGGLWQLQAVTPSLIHIVIPQQGGGLWQLQAVIGCEEQRGLEPKAVIEHNHRGLHRHLSLWPILCL